MKLTVSYSQMPLFIAYKKEVAFSLFRSNGRVLFGEYEMLLSSGLRTRQRRILRRELALESLESRQLLASDLSPQNVELLSAASSYLSAIPEPTVRAQLSDQLAGGTPASIAPKDGMAYKLISSPESLREVLSEGNVSPAWVLDQISQRSPSDIPQDTSAVAAGVQAIENWQGFSGQLGAGFGVGAIGNRTPSETVKAQNQAALQGLLSLINSSDLQGEEVEALNAATHGTQMIGSIRVSYGYSFSPPQ